MFHDFTGVCGDQYGQEGRDHEGAVLVAQNRGSRCSLTSRGSSHAFDFLMLLAVGGVRLFMLKLIRINIA